MTQPIGKVNETGIINRHGHNIREDWNPLKEGAHLIKAAESQNEIQEKGKS